MNKMLYFRLISIDYKKNITFIFAITGKMVMTTFNIRFNEYFILTVISGLI